MNITIKLWWLCGSAIESVVKIYFNNGTWRKLTIYIWLIVYLYEHFWKSLCISFSYSSIFINALCIFPDSVQLHFSVYSHIIPPVYLTAPRGCYLPPGEEIINFIWKQPCGVLSTALICSQGNHSYKHNWLLNIPLRKDFQNLKNYN